MLKIGLENIIADATVSAVSTNPSYPVANIKDSSLKRWQSLALTDTVTITFTAQAVEMIALGNVNGDSITVTGKLATATVFSETYTVTSGTSFMNLYVPQTGTIDELVIAFDNSASATVPFLGYVWIGDRVDFTIQDNAIQAIDESTATVAISRGSVAEQNPGYMFRAYSITLGYEDYSTMRTKVRRIMTEGYAVPRPYVIDSDCLPLECVFGILDAPRVGYDISEIVDKTTGMRHAQATIGITETSGGSSR